MTFSPPFKAEKNYSLALFNRRELETTLTERNAMAAPSTHGTSSPIAVTGIPAVLYPNA